jgi:hypothetical protein
VSAPWRLYRGLQPHRGGRWRAAAWIWAAPSCTTAATMCTSCTSRRPSSSSSSASSSASANSAAGKLELGFENWLLFFSLHLKFPRLISPTRHLIAALEHALVAKLGVVRLPQAVSVGLLHLHHHLSCCGCHCQQLTQSSSFCYCHHG